MDASVFFYLSKIIWFVISPGHLLLALLSLGLLLSHFGLRRACWLWMPALSLLLALTVLPLGNLLLDPLERIYPAVSDEQLPEQDELAGIIVLGGAERAQLSSLTGLAEFNASAERVMLLPALLAKYPQLPALVTGGSGEIRQQTYKGADVAQHWLESIGLTGRVLYERQSRNTRENATLSRELLEQQGLGEALNGRWLLVTSAYHMPRSMAVFKQDGWNVQAYPVDFTAEPFRLRGNLWKNLRELSIATREWVGLVAYYMTGKTPYLLPNNNNQEQKSS